MHGREQLLHQVDIKGAYLNGNLTDDEVIYIILPSCNRVPDINGHVLHLVCTLYGLEQPGHCWYQKLVFIFGRLGFSQAQVNQVVFYWCNEQGVIFGVVTSMIARLLHAPWPCLLISSSTRKARHCHRLRRGSLALVY